MALTYSTLTMLTPTQEGQRDTLIGLIDASLQAQFEPGAELFTYPSNNANGAGDPAVRAAVANVYLALPANSWSKAEWRNLAVGGWHLILNH